jgi:hypothetical protein
LLHPNAGQCYKAFLNYSSSYFPQSLKKHGLGVYFSFT